MNMFTALKTTRVVTALILSSLLALAGCGGGGGGAPATPAALPNVTTAQEVPAPILPDAAAATPGGMASFTLYSTNKLRGSMTLTGFNLSGTPATTAVTAAHIHDGDIGFAPASNVVKALIADAAKVVWSLPANTVLTAAEVARFKAGGYYVNAHTATNGAGLIRGQLISFTDNIQAIFTTSCAVSFCHVTGGPAPMSLASGAARGNLVNVLASTTGGTRVIAGDSANSILFKRINGTTAGTQMPPNGSLLSANNQNLIKVWIDTGAANN